jgi:hypothetical protein
MQGIAILAVQSREIPSPKKIRVRYAIENRPIVMYTGVLNAFLRTAASLGEMIPVVLAR